MGKFLLSERFRLELHWKKCIHSKAGEMHFEGAYFSGPVLKQAVELNQNDHIELDFCNQTLVVVHGVYVGTFAWSGVDYKDDKILLKAAMLMYDKKLKNIPKLENTDYLVIDTRNHENEKHNYNTLYPTYVVSKGGELYDYRR
jgi:hypothetical protein